MRNKTLNNLIINMEVFNIIYSNHFKIGNKTFAFRKKELFDITNMPTHIPINEDRYWLCGRWYALDEIQKIIKKEPITVDVSSLQWYRQIELDEVFNLDRVDREIIIEEYL